MTNKQMAEAIKLINDALLLLQEQISNQNKIIKLLLKGEE